MAPERAKTVAGAPRYVQAAAMLSMSSVRLRAVNIRGSKRCPSSLRPARRDVVSVHRTVALHDAHDSARGTARTSMHAETKENGRTGGTAGSGTGPWCATGATLRPS